MPSSPEEVKETGKDFPHKLDEITKQALSTKLKAVQFEVQTGLGFRQKKWPWKSRTTLF